MESQYLLGFFAGGLSLLAPCVLPILPLIISSSLKSSRFGPLLNALGLTLSFSFFGILTSVFASFLDPELFQKIGALILVFVGLVFLLPILKDFSGGIFQKLSDVGYRLQSKVRSDRPLSEFFAGALLGLIWSPCTGPTLAFAVGLASQSKNLGQASLIFFFFGLGAGLGLVVLGSIVKRFSGIRTRLARVGQSFNVFVGVLSIFLGILILTGLDAELEESVLNLLPASIIKLSTQF